MFDQDADRAGGRQLVGDDKPSPVRAEPRGRGADLEAGEARQRPGSEDTLTGEQVHGRTGPGRDRSFVGFAFGSLLRFAFTLGPVHTEEQFSQGRGDRAAHDPDYFGRREISITRVARVHR